jgi:hypothetical protein
VCATAAAAAAGAVHRFESCIHTGCRVDDGHGRACHTLVLGFKGGGSHPQPKQNDRKKQRLRKEKRVVSPVLSWGNSRPLFMGCGSSQAIPRKDAQRIPVSPKPTHPFDSGQLDQEITHTRRAHTHTHTHTHDAHTDRVPQHRQPASTPQHNDARTQQVQQDRVTGQHAGRKGRGERGRATPNPEAWR